MKIYGLTGGIASGKSTASNFFKQKNIPIIDCDNIAHDILTLPKVYEKIREQIGSDVFEEKVLNRKLLGKKVFNDSVLLAKLEEITHPLILDEIKRMIVEFQEAGEENVILDAPLLFELKLEEKFELDEIILITISLETQILRLKSRNNLNREDSLKIINKQMPNQEKIKKSTIVVNNDVSLEDFKNDLEFVYLLHIQNI